MMKKTSPAAKIFSWVFALFWLVVCLLPFTQLISVTFSTADRGIVSTFYPNSLSSGIENIKQALLQTNLAPSTFQTLIYVSVTIVGMLIVSSLAAYELACFKFPGRDVIFMLILSSMMLPMITYVIPLYRFVYNLGWSDTLIGLAIPSIPSAFAVFIIRQFLESMPHELIEAGEIDGAGHLKIFLRVVLPLMATPLLTVTVIQFMQVWGSFLWPTLVAGTKWKPVSVLVAGLLGDGSWIEGRVKIAAMLLSGIPPVAVYLVFQKYIVEGIATSGLKG
ncbi:carbohydrate ABC transporter permease [Ruthenibacterium sp. CLA-JM-H11]|uniref:Carbohydrate ABC transporter permease n=1 Tax=Ruthenibacterium intestinale TaxID=3133163 RepID=A0ABV1GIX5_9FIRM